MSVPKSFSERLGCGPDDRLLIVHCDDFGMCHAENTGTIIAMEKGIANSASIMAPCPWRNEAIFYAVSHPEADIGMHSTLTSEWGHYRWGPVAPVADVPTLVDDSGYLWPEEEPFAAHADPAHMEAELRAQYHLLTSRGVDVTHLDMHMQAVVSAARYFDVYVKLAQEWRIPFMLPRLDTGVRALFDADYQKISKETEEEIVAKGLFAVDRLVMDVIPGEGRRANYVKIIEELTPGITQIIVHVAEDTDELRAAAQAGPDDEGATYRVDDLACLTHPDVVAAVKESGVRMVTWREIREAMYS